MSAIYEMPRSRTLSVSARTPAARLAFVAVGYDDESAAWAAVAAATNFSYYGLTRQSLTINPQGGGVWFADIDYGLGDAMTKADGTPLDGQGSASQPPNQPQRPDDNEPLPPDFGFDTSGKTVRITQSLATVWSDVPNRDPDEDIPNYNRAIGVSKDKIEGVEIYAPNQEWTESKRFAFVTRKYYEDLVRMTGTTNDAPFWGFKIGEVLFLGATGRGNSENGWECTFKFAVSLREDGIELCDGLTVPSKSGWDYLWVAYAPDDSAGRMVEKPIFASVERVYKSSNFSKLGIGM